MPPQNDGFVARDVEFPDRMQRRIGRMLRDWDGITPISDGGDFEAIARWVSENYLDQSIHESEWDLPAPVSLGDIGTWLQNQLDNGEMQPLTGNERVNVLEYQIGQRLEKLETAFKHEGWLFGIRACGAVAVRSRNKYAIVAYVQTGGYSADWYGVFPSFDSVWAALRNDGYMLNGQGLIGEMRANVRKMLIGRNLSLAEGRKPGSDVFKTNLS